MAIERNGNPEHSTRFVVCPIDTVFLELATLELKTRRITQSIESTAPRFTPDGAAW